LTDAVRTSLTDLCAIVRWCFGAAAVSIAVVVDEGLTYVAAEGATGDAIVGTTLPAGQGIAGFVAATGQSIAVHDLDNDPRFARDVAERVGYIPRSIQCIPFNDDAGDVVGVISLLDRTDTPTTAPPIEWFTAMAATLCGSATDAPSPYARLEGLAAADRELATTVIDAVIDAFHR